MEELQKVIGRLQRLHSETYLASPAAIFEAMAGFMRDDLHRCIDELNQAESELRKERAV